MKQISKDKRFSFPLWDIYFTFKEQLILFCLVLLGLVIRIINAVSTPLWRDEVYIFFTARDNSLWKLITQQHWDTAHPPLHSIFLHFWQMISIHPFWLRLPSLIASLFILYLIPLLAVKITKKNKVFPFVFLFFFSFSHTQISLNIVVRPYPFVLLFTISSLILFLTMIEKKQENHKVMGWFIAANFLAIQTDYSAVWLFFVYFIFFIFGFIRGIIKKERRLYVFVSLACSGLASLLLLPLLITNLPHSLYLERYNSPVKLNEKTFKQGTNMYVQLLPDKHELNYLDQNFNKIKGVFLSPQAFEKKKLYLGLNLPPLSALYLNTLDVCKGNSSEDVKKQAKDCKYVSFLNNIRENSLFFLPNGIKILHLLPQNALVINRMSEQWIAHVDGRAISFKTGEQILLKISFGSYYFTDYPGIYLYENPDLESPLWWKNVRINISAPNGEYRIYYYGGQSSIPTTLLNQKTLFERFSGDILFFTGFPNTINQPLISISYLLFSVILIFLIFMGWRNRIVGYYFVMALYIVPIVTSYIISYYYAPIFLGRNLYISNVAYLISLSLLVGVMWKEKNSFFHSMSIAIVVGYLLLFGSSFPYLHYVDPSYDMNKILKKMTSSNSAKKYVILKDFNQYPPLLRYVLLSSGNIEKILIFSLEPLDEKKILEKAPVSFLQYLNGKIRTKTLLPGEENSRTIFFLKFGSIVEPEVSGEEFLKMKNYFDCDLKEIKIPYVYFAKCE